MADARLEVNDGLGRRVVPLDKPRAHHRPPTESDLRLVGSDVSREHAEICRGRRRLRCCATAARATAPSSTASRSPSTRWRTATASSSAAAAAPSGVPDRRRARRHDRSIARPRAVGDLRQIAALLEGLRALGSGRVLDEVLALVLDAAIEVTGAERGFIMLADADSELEFKLARARGPHHAAGHRLRHQPQDPRGGLRHRRAQDRGRPARRRPGQRAQGHGRARHPPRAVHRRCGWCATSTRPTCRAKTEDHRRALPRQPREGRLLSRRTRGRRSRRWPPRPAWPSRTRGSTARRSRRRTSSRSCRSPPRSSARCCPRARTRGRSSRPSATSLPARSIGGDFFDYLDLPDGELRLPASATSPARARRRRCSRRKIQGVFSAQVSGRRPAADRGPREPGAHRRADRVALRHASTPSRADGSCLLQRRPQPAAGLRPRAAVRRLEAGGMPVGLFDCATYRTSGQLAPGDTLIIVQRRRHRGAHVAGDEFGEERMVECCRAHAEPAAGDARAADHRRAGVRAGRRAERRRDGAGGAVPRARRQASAVARGLPGSVRRSSSGT